MGGAEDSAARAQLLLREVQQPRVNGVARWDAVWRVPSRSTLLIAMLAVPAISNAQVSVRDDIGAPVPFAILEAPDGRRAIAGADGVAPTMARWRPKGRARRIGYRPAKDDDGDGVIVLSRTPVVLASQEVRALTACSAERVAMRAPGSELDAIRSILLEGHDRRVIAGAGGAQVLYRAATTLVTEDGRRFDGGEDRCLHSCSLRAWSLCLAAPSNG